MSVAVGSFCKDIARNFLVQSCIITEPVNDALLPEVLHPVDDVLGVDEELLRISEKMSGIVTLDARSGNFIMTGCISFLPPNTREDKNIWMSRRKPG